MSRIAEQLKEQLATLSAEDRLELLEYLEETLHNGSDEEIEAAWEAELERRWQRIEKGETVGIPVEQVMAELRAKYG